MHGLLARLKAVQNAEPDVPQSNDVKGINDGTKTNITDGIKSNFTPNQFINHAVLNGAVNKVTPNGYDDGYIDEFDSDRETLKTPDDGAVIDLVMATNKLTGKPRHRSSTSTPRQILKSTKSRGSRVSLNSEALSEETLNLDSDDDAFTAQKTERYTPSQAWAAFENCVKNIDNSNPEYFIKKPKPNFVASGTFQQVMEDMYGNTEYGNTKGYTLLKQKLNNMAKSTMHASRMMHAAVNKGQEERENEENHPDDNIDAVQPEVAPETHAEPESVTKVFAKRGWKILKREVNETLMETKTQSTKLNWTMLQHTLKQMTNTEKTRQDLYERYGILPTTLPDGSVVCENRMLSERARAQLYGRNKDGAEYKRPASYQPPSLHLRSRSQIGYQAKTREGAKSAKISNIGRGRMRPITAKR